MPAVSSTALDLNEVTEFDLSLLEPDLFARVTSYHDVVQDAEGMHLADCRHAAPDAPASRAPALPRSRAPALPRSRAPASSLWPSLSSCCDGDPRVEHLADAISSTVQGIRAGAPTPSSWFRARRAYITRTTPATSAFLPHVLSALDDLEEATRTWVMRDGLNHLFEVAAVCTVPGSAFPTPVPGLALSPPARALKDLPGSVIVVVDPADTFHPDLPSTLVDLDADVQALEELPGSEHALLLPRGLLPLVEYAARTVRDPGFLFKDVSSASPELIDTAFTLLRDGSDFTIDAAFEAAVALL